MTFQRSNPALQPSTLNNAELPAPVHRNIKPLKRHHNTPNHRGPCEPRRPHLPPQTPSSPSPGFPVVLRGTTQTSGGSPDLTCSPGHLLLVSPHSLWKAMPRASQSGRGAPTGWPSPAGGGGLPLSSGTEASLQPAGPLHQPHAAHRQGVIWTGTVLPLATQSPTLSPWKEFSFT